jgi:LmbE family N-acetylglucosaminyl deacetylase
VTFPPSPPPLEDVERVLCVFAHPDDVDFSSAGTVARWVDDGLEVAYLLATRGDAGGFDDTPRAEMPITPEAEQRAAAAAVGVKQVDFLDGYADGTLSPTIPLRKDITTAIRRFRPDRVLTSSPLRRWERIAGPSHPDHLAVGEATTCAIYPDARNPVHIGRPSSAGLAARWSTWFSSPMASWIQAAAQDLASEPRLSRQCGGMRRTETGISSGSSTRGPSQRSSIRPDSV